MESFSTRSLPIPRKISFWNTVASEAFAQMEVRPRDVFRFDGILRRERIGTLAVLEVHSSAVTIHHTRAHISGDSAPSYLLLAPMCSELDLSFDGASTVKLKTGECCLLDHARPYVLGHGDGVRALCVDIPRDSLERRLYGAHRLAGLVMRPECAMSRMLMSLLQTLSDEIASPRGTNLPAALGDSLLEFAAATYGGCADALGVGSRADAIRACIDSRLTDPGLAPEEIASYFGVSARTLRAILRSQGESFSEYVLRRRLERCAELLANSASVARTITQIAFRAGFSNATHFGQAFKSRFGVTPREYRLGRPASKQRR